MNQPKKTCPKCSKQMVNVKRSRPVSVGRSRMMECLDCHHRWSSVEMTYDWLREKLMRGDFEAMQQLAKLVNA